MKKKSKIERYTDQEALDYHNSGKSGKIEILSSKPMEKVLIFFDEIFCIRAAIIDESIPPDKNTPNGTSDILCPSNTSSKISSSCFLQFS